MRIFDEVLVYLLRFMEMPELTEITKFDTSEITVMLFDQRLP